MIQSDRSFSDWYEYYLNTARFKIETEIPVPFFVSAEWNCIDVTLKTK